MAKNLQNQKIDIYTGKKNECPENTGGAPPIIWEGPIHHKKKSRVSTVKYFSRKKMVGLTQSPFQ